MVANIISGSLIFATALLFGALGGDAQRAGRRHQLRCGRFHDFWGFLLRYRRQLRRIDGDGRVQPMDRFIIGLCVHFLVLSDACAGDA